MWWVFVFVFLAAWFVQLAWYYTLYLIWNQYAPSLPQTIELPPVSVIVCAHNEVNNLEALLPLLYQQQYPAYEIVVVEDTSCDGSLDFLLAQKERHPNLKIVWLRDHPEHVGGKKYALTLGIRAAQYDHLLLTDADCRPGSPHWVRSMMQSWDRRHEFVLGYSPYQAQPGWLNLFIRYETLHTGMMYMGAALKGYPYMGVGRNLAYRKLFFLQEGGFRRFWHVTGGDDDLFVNRHATAENTIIVTHTDSQVYSVPKQRWRAYFRQKIRHLSVGKWYKQRDKRWLGMFSVTSILVGGVGLVLAISGEWIWITFCFLLRWGMMYRAIRTTSHKLNDSIPLHILPIFDFLYVIYYISIGPIALLSKYIRWK